MPTKLKPSPYSKGPFLAVRAITFASSLIVSGVLGWFCYQLKHDGFKLPWTFLLILMASSFTVITILITSAVYSCGSLSPIFNLVLNVPLILIWIASFSLLTYNTYGTLAHSCTKSNWANNDGLMVCRSYKANYSFIVIAIVSFIAMIIVDIRARREQITRSKYEKMDNKIKEEKRESDPSWTAGHERESSYHDTIPYGVDPDARRPKSVATRDSSLYGHAQDEYHMRDFTPQVPNQHHVHGYGSDNFYSGYQTGYQR